MQYTSLLTAAGFFSGEIVGITTASSKQTTEYTRRPPCARLRGANQKLTKAQGILEAKIFVTRTL